MASGLMLDDRLQIDKFNPTTWTGDFGVNHDGFPKDFFIDGSTTNGIDETPVSYDDTLRMKPFGTSGNMNLKTIASGDAPNGIFTARKYEYSNGKVTWVRPEQPWSWINLSADGRVGLDKKTDDNNQFLFWIILVILVLFFFSRK